MPSENKKIIGTLANLGSVYHQNGDYDIEPFEIRIREYTMEKMSECTYENKSQPFLYWTEPSILTERSSVR